MARTPAQMRLRDFSRSLPMSLLKAREAVMSHFRPSLNHFGISEQQWRVLRALSAVETIEVMALAERTFLLPPSLSRILKDLDARGLIVRRTSDTDLRRGLILLSTRGRDLIAKAGAHSEAIYLAMTERYGADKLAQLQDMLHELETVLAAPIEASAVPERNGKKSRNGAGLRKAAAAKRTP